MKNEKLEKAFEDLKRQLEILKTQEDLSYLN